MGLKPSRMLSRLAPVLLVAACASGPGGEGAATTATPSAGTDLAVIEVTHNDAGAARTLTILVEPDAGIRSPLGTIEPGQTRSFSYDARAGNYRLVAQGGKTSGSFRLSNREIATWDMQTNRVRLRNKT